MAPHDVAKRSVGSRYGPEVYRTPSDKVAGFRQSYVSTGPVCPACRDVYESASGPDRRPRHKFRALLTLQGGRLLYPEEAGIEVVGVGIVLEMSFWREPPPQAFEWQDVVAGGGGFGFVRIIQNCPLAWLYLALFSVRALIYCFARGHRGHYFGFRAFGPLLV